VNAYYQRPPEHFVSHSMSTDLLTVGREESLVVAAGRMMERKVGAVLVIEDDELVGILSERDIMRAVAESDVGGAVSAWMTSDPVTVEPGATNSEAAMMMIHGGFRHVPVCEGGRPVGIVSMRDLMRLANESPAGV
jgi:CBS domain-containing protein